MKEELLWHRGFLPHTRAFKTPDAPQPAKIDLSKSLGQLLQGYQNTAGGFLDLQKQYQPGYTQLGLDNQNTSLFGYTGTDGTVHPGTVGLGAEANSLTRGANIGDLSAMGPAITGSILQGNPFLAGAASNLYDTLGNVSAIANDPAALRGEISPSESRDLQETIGANFANTGMGPSNSSMAAQLLGRDAFTQGRKQQAFSNLSTAAQLGQGATSAFSSAFTNPLLQILQLGNLNPGSDSSGSGVLGSSLQNSNALFPLAPGFDIAGFNANAQNASNIAGANNSAASSAGWLSLIGALISDDRMKDEIVDTGERTKDGIPIVTFVYKLDSLRQKMRGVLASAVERLRPDAVVRFPFMGLRLVNYGMLEV